MKQALELLEKWNSISTKTIGRRSNNCISEITQANNVEGCGAKIIINQPCSSCMAKQTLLLVFLGYTTGFRLMYNLAVLNLRIIAKEQLGKMQKCSQPGTREIKKIITERKGAEKTDHEKVL